MTYSLEFRKHVFRIKDQEQLSYRKTAQRFGIGSDTLVRWGRKIMPQGKRAKEATKVSTEALMRDIDLYPDS